MSRSRLTFLALLLLLAAQRLLELRHSRRNAAALLRQGGREHAAAHFRLAQVLHTSWFLSMIVEVLWRRPPFRPLQAALAAGLVLAGQALRYAAIRALGPRWTVTVVTLPGSRPVTVGVYRYLRHPNYVGVVLELAAFPLLHSAYWTALVFSVANLFWLRARIRAEERALAADSDYDRYLGHRPRFLPIRPAVPLGNGR